MLGYYYCSLSTFINILKNKHIYLSDPLKMNDDLEIRWYIDRLKDEESNDGLEESVFNMMKIRSNIDFTYEELVESLNSRGQRSIYICCFSKEADILSQWRAYAEDGKGVSIGFDLEKLEKIADNILINEVIYENNVGQDKIESDVESVADEIKIVLNEHAITVKEEQIDVFLHELIPVLAKYKNPAFIEEKEIRLIYCDDMKFEKIVDRHDAFQEDWKSKELDHDFRVIDSNNITEFVKLYFAPDIIKKICIGPKCLLSKNDTKNIAKKLLGVEVEVIKSKSSYR